MILHLPAPRKKVPWDFYWTVSSRKWHAIDTPSFRSLTLSRVVSRNFAKSLDSPLELNQIKDDSEDEVENIIDFDSDRVVGYLVYQKKTF